MSPEERAARADARKAAREAAKTQARIDAEKNQKPVQSITINIEWVKSRTWGSNPHATAEVHYQDGTFERRNGYKCSGCGYDKESTVIADVFNTFLRRRLWELPETAIRGGHGSRDNGPAPYGITCYSADYRSFAGGIGTDCYRAISEYIGGTWEHIASGKAFDAYKFATK